MLRMCAWCRKQIGTSNQSVHANDVVSHGICKSCTDNLTFQMGVLLTRFLDTFPEPIVAMDGNCLVRTANSAACRVLGKQAAAMERRLGGDVFECAYARLPEGCGRTIHCSGCAIRRAVTNTYQTGQPHYRIPAALNREDPDHPLSIAMFITTVKVNDLVLLRVDRMDDPATAPPSP